MRRYQMWLAAGILALGPALTYGGPFSFGRSSAKPAQQAEMSRTEMLMAGSQPIIRAQSPDSNEAMAKNVARAISAAKVGRNLEISFQNGTARLEGRVSSAEEAKMVVETARRVKGVTRVEPHLMVPKSSASKGAAKPGGQQQVAARRPQQQRRGAISQANFEDGVPPGPDEGMDGVPVGPVGPGGMPMQVGPQQMGPPQMMPGQMMPGQMGGPPGAMPGGMPSTQVYDQPNVPSYAWPSYAAYPNSAAVNYPTQYSASAWPYIGPFYPYPQVPLGWRKAQLEWDDGYWHLNFRPRTDRWWWFLDYKNW